MDFTIIAETNGDSLHPTTYQLIGAAASMGSNSTVICPNGVGASEAAKINGVEKVISANGDCFNIFDGAVAHPPSSRCLVAVGHGAPWGGAWGRGVALCPRGYAQ